MLLSPVVIPFLTKLKVGQTERAEGVQSHLKKAGTPTMGGLIILISILVTSLFFIHDYPRIVPVLFLTLGFGIIGFLDDYLKVVLRRSDGLMPGQKMICQLVVTTIFVVYIWVMDSSCLELDSLYGRLCAVRPVGENSGHPPVLFCGDRHGKRRKLYGRAGRAGHRGHLHGSGLFTVASIVLGGEIEPITAAVLGALLGFLLFNVHPAKVFMGDTGSLALGGFVAGSAYMMKLPVFILIIGLIYLVEVLSVMIQVTYFKKTGESVSLRWPPFTTILSCADGREPRIVTVFTVITAFLCLIAMMGLQ